MKNVYLKMLIYFSSLLVSACGQSQTSNSTKAESGPGTWNFQLKSSMGFQLNDQSSATVQDLLNQIRSLYESRMFFRDPVKLSLSDSLLVSQITAFGSRKTQTVKWDLTASKSTQWQILGCQWQSSFLACEYKPLLRCLSRQAEEGSRSVGDSENSSSTQAKSLLFKWVTACGLNEVFPGSTDPTVSFKIDNGQISFAPSPILGFVIYPGVWASYEDAVVQSIATATLAAEASCQKETGACRASPQPLTECQGCEKLTKGSLYTVFFIETLRQEYDKVLSFLFTP